jgi:hypothetical protein
MKLPKFTLPVIALVAVNILPLIGVIWLDWDAMVIILLYWCENIVLGVYNILKMALLPVDHPIEHAGKAFGALFFSIHFGGFCAVHGVFLLVFLNMKNGDVASGVMDGVFPDGTWLGPLVFLQLLFGVVSSLWKCHPDGMGWLVLCLFISHGISFVQNYILKKEYKSMNMQKLMNQPYKRIVILHLAIIAGAAPIMALGSPVFLLMLLVAGKIWLDIWLHLKEHKEKGSSLDAGDAEVS